MSVLPAHGFHASATVSAEEALVLRKQSDDEIFVENFFIRSTEKQGFPQARVALATAAEILPSLDLKTASILAHAVVDRLLARMSALHLLDALWAVLHPLLQRLLDKSLTADLQDGTTADAWRSEAFDIMTNLALRLTPYDDPRARSVAIKLVHFIWTYFRSNSSEEMGQDQDALSRGTNVFKIICGTVPQDHEVAKATVSGVSIRPQGIYEHGFLHSSICCDLLRSAKEAPREQVLCLIAAQLHCCTSEQVTNVVAQTLFDFVERLPTAEVKTDIGEVVLANFVAYIIKCGWVSPKRRKRWAVETLDRCAKISPSIVGKMAWVGLLRGHFAIQPKDIWFYPTTLKAALNGQKLMLRDPFGFFHSALATSLILEDPDSLERYLAGISHKASRDRLDLCATSYAWHMHVSNGLNLSGRAVSSALRLSILGRHWGDVLDLLRDWLNHETAADNRKAGQEALNALAADLAIIGAPMERINENQVPSWPLPPDFHLTGSAYKSRLPRALLGSALESGQADVCYLLWKHAPLLCGAQHDATSLSMLLAASLRCSRAGRKRRLRSVHSEKRQDKDGRPAHRSRRSEVHLWDGLQPIIQAQRIFRAVLFSAHPEVTKAQESAVAAVSINLSKPVNRQTATSLQQSRMPQRSESEATLSDAMSPTDMLPMPDGLLGAASTAVAAHQSGSTASTEDAPWTSVAFNAQLFERYMLVLRRAHLDQGANMLPHERTSWKEPLRVLSWMRHLKIQPTPPTLAIAALALTEALPPAMNDHREETDSRIRSTWDEIARTIPGHQVDLPTDPENAWDRAELMGHLRPWCLEWVDVDRFPTVDTISEVRCRTEH